MRSKKRDRLERAYHLGYKCGVKGKSMEICPFNVASTRGIWMGGWREGRTAREGML